MELRVNAQSSDHFLHCFITTTDTLDNHLNHHCYIKTLICSALNFLTAHFYSTKGACPSGNTPALIFPYIYTHFNELAPASSLYVHYKSAKQSVSNYALLYKLHAVLPSVVSISSVLISILLSAAATFPVSPWGPLRFHIIT